MTSEQLLKISTTLRSVGKQKTAEELEKIWLKKLEAEKSNGHAVSKPRKISKLKTAISSSMPPKYKTLSRDHQQILLHQIDEVMKWCFNRFRMIGNREVEPSDKDWLKIYYKADIAKLLTTLVDLAMLRFQGKS